MALEVEIETIIVSYKTVQKNFPGGWKKWKAFFSNEDDGNISRVSFSSGKKLYDYEQKLIKFGFRKPVFVNEIYQFLDYYIYSKDYKQPIPRKLPDWLDMNLIGKGMQIKAQFNYKNKE